VLLKSDLINPGQSGNGAAYLKQPKVGKNLRVLKFKNKISENFFSTQWEFFMAILVS
jgi:hypothetical protein